VTSSNPALLTVRDLHTHFFTARGVVRAVDGISFQVGEGEAVGIVGESGSGKSMTALSIVGLVPPPGRIVSGSIEFGGHDLLTLDQGAMRAVRATDLAMIFQDPGAYLNPVMTIGEQIAEAIGKRRAKDAKTRESVLAALREVQISEPARVAASYPHELSGGMQQRAMIASALIRRPRLIVADEPTTALDATVQHQILELLGELRTRIKVSLILISHDLAVVSNVCDRVYVMYAGQIVERGPAAELFRHPQHPYAQALVDSILDPWAPARDIPLLPGSPPDMIAPPAGCRFHPRCRHVMDICRRVQPATVELNRDQAAMCWLHQPEQAPA
jgi:oligopeptide/dipeptide ABC transporter ATP-binding protein